MFALQDEDGEWLAAASPESLSAVVESLNVKGAREGKLASVMKNFVTEIHEAEVAEVEAAEAAADAARYLHLQHEIFSSSLLLSSLELSDTKVYEPCIRANLTSLPRNPRPSHTQSRLSFSHTPSL